MVGSPTTLGSFQRQCSCVPSPLQSSSWKSPTPARQFPVGQRLVKNGQVPVSQILGTENVADIGTKPLSESVFEKHRRNFGFVQSADSDCGLVELITSSGDDHTGRRGVPAKTAAVPEKILALAIALAGCVLEGTEGAEVVVCVTPTSARLEAAPVITSWMIRCIATTRILSLVCTWGCAWRARGLWGWFIRKPVKNTAAKCVQSQTTY